MRVDESLLDDHDRLVEADPAGVLRALATAGAQVRESCWLTREAGLDRLIGGERPRAVLVACLGGSAVIADVLGSLTGRSSPVPVMARRGGPLPGWVGALDLVVAVSLSGRAPGPLALATEAGRRGARLVTVCAAGSPLAGVCEQAGGLQVPLAEGLRSRRSPAARMSRTALWSLLTPVLVAADAVGVVSADQAVLDGVATVLDEQAEACRPRSESFVNPGKLLALELDSSVPVVLGDGDLMGAAAARAASMLLRTARIPAVHGALPDDAGEVVATFGGPFAPGIENLAADVFSDPFEDGARPGPRLRLLLLRDSESEPDAVRSADAVQATAEEAGVRVSEVVSERGHPLNRLASVISRTDFAATYLALGGGLDPAISPQVADLRERIV